MEAVRHTAAVRLKGSAFLPEVQAKWIATKEETSVPNGIETTLVMATPIEMVVPNRFLRSMYSGFRLLPDLFQKNFEYAQNSLSKLMMPILHVRAGSPQGSVLLHAGEPGSDASWRSMAAVYWQHE
ncbi:hypothetical protein EGT07_05230 [Herbaspirillum sp. HC18]|nr:hypothetical protein EGT07_05230 [Herbaspirillum sp. HC18]